MPIGIEAINAYVGQTSLKIQDLFKARNLESQRFGNLLMNQKSVGLPCEDPITHAVNAAKPLIDSLSESEKNQIELVITATESGLDFGKSLSTYIHDYLGLKKNCRLFEIKQACYAGTAGLQMAAGIISPQTKGLVISTDTARAAIKYSYAEPSQGVAAVAMLISDKPDILALDFGANGYYGYEVMDTCRPQAEIETGDADLSLLSYTQCLSNCFEHYREKMAGINLNTDFDYLAFHTPFAGLVKSAHRHLMREFTKLTLDEIESDFKNRMENSVYYGQLVGNVYSGSLYLALCSTIDRSDIQHSHRIGLYSYGSGCSSEFYSGIISEKSKAKLAPMQISDKIKNRYLLNIKQYDELLELNHSLGFGIKDQVITPSPFGEIYEKQLQHKKLLVLKSIKNYHREYDWS